MRKVKMTGDNLKKMGYEYDLVYRGWFTPQKSPCPRFFFPPFGCSDKMLAEGLQFWVDENGRFKRFKFGATGRPLNLEYL